MEFCTFVQKAFLSEGSLKLTCRIAQALSLLTRRVCSLCQTAYLRLSGAQLFGSSRFEALSLGRHRRLARLDESVVDPVPKYPL